MIVPAPQGFIEPNNVQWVKHSSTCPPFLRRGKVSGRKAEGIRYEFKAQEYLLCNSDFYLPSPWFYYKGNNRLRWCQPDGLLFNFRTGHLIIVEIKYNHTSDAWWQLRKLYFPIIVRIFPPELWTISVLEVVKWYDPATHFPEQLRLIAKPDEAFGLPQGITGVHIWRP